MHTIFRNIPKRRNYKADLNVSRVTNWNKNGKLVTHYMNGLSPLFPFGERFFLDSVRHYRSRIKEDWLKESVDGFIGQEVMHGKMHDQYDDALRLSGLPSDAIENYTKNGLKLITKITSPKLRLALTCAAEHYTSTMAKHLLENPDIIKGSEESYAWLWKTHAVEEYEHRSVTYDVYQTFENDYKTRVVAFFLTTAVLFPVFAINCIWMAIADAGVKSFSLKEMCSLVKVVGGMWIEITPELSEYVRKDFHPQDSKEPKGYHEAKAEIVNT